ncbi:PAS/PAC sensor-containing diguanylate cyclase/phosphodiesterase [Sulfuricella denitrificans skB26]|uniref:PAS/PAC sensor-containing diguanylate cyclase/phosphodiesterase n=1 Tax=Sulfuricella denitrificans (strain DSM 22764 / NBRC 105220 / skB26) TaxID=1163617 RepID=S6AHN6_SULDS|nr:sensor domain-containing diguanylate cyclase [Sulfuricella denitrificans]BAN34039.1 PAS/PAC sensor-containing diguanylate cyclase/phosphodiesterase [Sulfuricella denitrificans skB26]
MENEHSFIAAVLDTIGALVVVLDRNGRVIRFNRQCEKLTGYSAAEMIGRPIWERLLIPEELQPVRSTFDRLVAGNFPSEFENWWLTKNGARRMIAWSNTALLDADGEVEFVIATGIDVTERRQIEAALRDSEERFRMLFNNGNDAILVHPISPGEMPGKFIEANDLACRRLDYSREELQQLSPLDIDDAVSAVDIPKISRQIEVEGHALFESVHVARDGRKIPVEINAHRFELKGRPVVLSIARDITERKLAEAALRESEAKLREITSELGDGIYVLDRNGQLTFMNKAAEHLLGWTEAELLGQNAHEAFHYQKPDGSHVPVCDCPVYQSIHSGETYRILEDYFTCKDGTLFPVSFVAAPLHRGGEITGSVAAFQDITERKQAEARIHHMAHHDMLTGLPNRVLLADRLVLALAQARRYGRLLTLIFLDLDHFKQINDTLGHDVGDELLKAVAARLVECVREADTVARMGGDEFVILLPETAKAGDAEIVARKVIEAVNLPLMIGSHELHITTSVGIALYPRDGEETQTLMKNADTAMYRAKESGRNGYQLYSQI